MSGKVFSNAERENEERFPFKGGDCHSHLGKRKEGGRDHR